MLLGEILLLTLAAPPLSEIAADLASRRSVIIVVNGGALLGAVGLAVSGAAMLATLDHPACRTQSRAGRDATARSGAAAIALAAAMSIGTVVRILDPGATDAVTAPIGRLVAVGLCSVLVLGSTRPCRTLGWGLVLLVASVVSTHLTHVVLDLPSGTVDAVRSWLGTLLLVAWTALALAAAAAHSHRRGPAVFPSWQLLLMISAMHALRLADGDFVGAGTMLAATIACVVGTSQLHAAWRRLQRESDRAVAERARLEAELGAAKHRAVLEVEHHEEVVHDARNACTGVRNAVELLCHHADDLDPATIERLRDLALGGVRHLERLMAPEGDAEIDFDPTRVVEVMVTRRRIAGTVAVLDVVDDPSQLTARGNPDDLATAVLNVLVNAERHARGSAVRVTVSRRDDEVVVAVADAGPGVPAELREHVFHRGARGGAGGHGLGLHIARSLMRAQNGDLRLAPSARGARFELSLPASGTLADATPPARTPTRIGV